MNRDEINRAPLTADYLAGFIDGEGCSDEHRKYAYSGGSHRMGRSTIWIVCPWCSTEFEAYVWSLAGSGKRCPGCKSLHTWGQGTAEKPPGKKVTR